MIRFKFNKENLPNLLTFSQILAIPVFVVVFYLPLVGGILACLVFIVASITDWLDGYYARKYGVKSELGRFLDPIADKLLVATALVLLVSQNQAHTLPVVLIICREIWVSGLREFLGAKEIVVPVTTLAKWKTTVQMMAVPLLLLGYAGLSKAAILGTFTLWIATSLTIYTGYYYTRSVWSHLK